MASNGESRRVFRLKKKWRERDTVKFVELYEEEEVLWNAGLQDYKNKNARNAAIQRIIANLNLEGLTTQDINSKINNIRSTYSQEKLKIKRTLGTGSGPDDVYISTLPWFKIADRFLSRVIRSRQMVQNVSCSEGTEKIEDTEKREDKGRREDTERRDDAEKQEDIERREGTQTGNSNGNEVYAKIPDPRSLFHQVKEDRICVHCRRLLEMSLIDVNGHTDSFEDYLRSHLLESCRYYSSLLASRIGCRDSHKSSDEKTENKRHSKAPSIDKRKQPAVKDIDRNLTKPTRVEFACQTVKRRPKQPISCYLSPTTSVLNIAEGEDLRAVYCMLSAIEGRIRRLKYNVA